MQTTKYTFQPTTPEHIPAILRIVSEAQQQLRELGANQWQNGYPNRATILEDISRGYSFVYTCNEEVIATLAFCTDREPTYDAIKGEWLSTSSSYGTIHRMCVDNRYKGQHIAGQLFALVEQQCQTQKLQFLRVDTHKSNRPMLKVIERQGFTYCGIIHVTDGSERLAFEKKVD
ncbi:MAG: GNAT family N-acetyltransferase [Bacteroidaceae bacterium]